MQPEQMIASAIERCGCSLEFLQAEGSVVLKAYLNPLRERAATTESHPEYLPQTKSPAGEGGKDRRRRFGNGAAGTMAAAGTL